MRRVGEIGVATHEAFNEMRMRAKLTEDECRVKKCEELGMASMNGADATAEVFEETEEEEQANAREKKEREIVNESIVFVNAMAVLNIAQ